MQDNQELFSLLYEMNAKLSSVQATLEAKKELDKDIKKDVDELKAFSNKAKGILGFLLAASSIAAFKALFF